MNFVVEIDFQKLIINKFFLILIVFLGLLTNLNAETLVEAVTNALDNYPSIEAVEAVEAAAFEDIKEAKAGYLPSVDFIGDTGYENAVNATTRSRNASVGSTDTDIETTRKTYEIKLTQNLYNGSYTKHQVEAAKNQAESSSFDTISTKENLALRTIQAYLSVINARKALKLSESNVKKHISIYNDVNAKAEEGSGNKGDVYQAESRLLLARSRYTQFKGNLSKAEAQYFEIVGILPGSLTPPRKIYELPIDVNHALETSIKKHPSIRSALAVVEAKRADFNGSKSSFLPKLDFELSHSYEEDTGGVEDDSRDTKAIFILYYNLFRGYGDVARRNKTRQLLKEAIKKGETLRLQVQKQMNLDFTDYEVARDKLVLLSERQKASESALENYIEQFKMGRRNLLNVLDVENELFQTKIDKLSGEMEYFYSQYKVLATMGSLLTTLGISNGK